MYTKTFDLMDMHHLVADGRTTEHRVERHVLGLFTVAEYRAALEATGLVVRHDRKGLLGRGLWIARRKTAPASSRVTRRAPR